MVCCWYCRQASLTFFTWFLRGILIMELKWYIKCQHMKWFKTQWIMWIKWLTINSCCYITMCDEGSSSSKYVPEGALGNLLSVSCWALPLMKWKSVKIAHYFCSSRKLGKQWILKNESLAQGGCLEKWQLPVYLLDVVFYIRL